MQRTIALVACLGLVACTTNDLTPADSGYGAGSLGNGGFAFTCDDSVVCGQYNAADQFPDTVAVGSTFTVRFIKSATVSSDVTGITVSTIGNDFFSTTGAGSFLAKQAGTGTIIAKDSSGSVVDYRALDIRRPDEIVVYDANDTTNVIPVTRVEMNVNDIRSYRALAREKGANLAGTLNYEWKSSDATVVRAYADANGKVSITGVKAGSATVTATGGTFEHSFTVTVQ